MSIFECRVCQHPLSQTPLLQYKNMPKSAQFLPDAAELNSEKGIDLNVHQCTGCGLIQLDCEPVFYFRDVIRAAAVSAEMHAFRLEQFRSWIEDYDLAGKSVIEIGAGAGEFLSILERCDVVPFGLEHNPASVDKACEAGLRVEQGFVGEGLTLSHGPFDAFIMLNFLEHLPDPNTSLTAIAQNLKPGALGLVEVPNFDMIIRQKLFSEFISDHLFYFTRETLIRTLERNNFDVLDCREVWHDYSLSAVVRKRSNIDLSTFAQQQASLKRAIHNYLEQFDDQQVAIWGAGHQSLAVMALTELAGKIRYVVDSAPFKQGRFTPATHIPIVAPEQLKLEPVAAIMVMAASYTDEVVGILSTHYPGINIAKLTQDGLVAVRNLTAE